MVVDRSRSLFHHVLFDISFALVCFAFGTFGEISENNLQQFWLVEVISFHCAHFRRENFWGTQKFQKRNHPTKWHLNQFVFWAYGMNRKQNVLLFAVQYLFIKMNKTWAKLCRKVKRIRQPCLGFVTAFFFYFQNSSFGLLLSFLSSFYFISFKVFEHIKFEAVKLSYLHTF